MVRLTRTFTLSSDAYARIIQDAAQSGISASQVVERLALALPAVDPAALSARPRIPDIAHADPTWLGVVVRRHAPAVREEIRAGLASARAAAFDLGWSLPTTARISPGVSGAERIAILRGLAALDSALRRDNPMGVEPVPLAP